MLRSFVHALPPPLRRQVTRAGGAVRARLNRFDLGRLRPFRTFDGRHVVVAGVFGAGTGLGRAAELVALTLAARGSTVTRVDLTAALGLPLRHADARCIAPAACGAADVTDVVAVLNPDQAVWRLFDRRWLLERTLIGHWIWEIVQLPPSWRRASEGFDEIWAGTDLVLDAIRSHLPGFARPLRLLPYAIDADPFPRVDPVRRAAVRAAEGIAPGSFVVGYSFAVGSNYFRKNPEDAVRVFTQAFPDAPDARLWLRCHDLGNRPYQRAALARQIGGDSRIVVHDETRQIPIGDFYAAIDVYLSTSRAEGYGLNLVEAAQSGVPVVTAGWRIAPEILALPGIEAAAYALEPVDDPQGHYTGLPGAMWSRPDIADMAFRLRRLRDTASGTPR